LLIKVKHSSPQQAARLEISFTSVTQTVRRFMHQVQYFGFVQSLTLSGQYACLHIMHKKKQAQTNTHAVEVYSCR